MKLPVLSMFAKAGIIGSLLVMASLTAAWRIEAHRADKNHAEAIKWRTAYAKLSEAGRLMQAENTRTITRWRTRIVEVDRSAKTVENAPLPGNCRSPEIIKEVVE